MTSFPLLEPSDWAYRDRMSHWRTGPEDSTAPIVVMAEDAGDEYRMSGFDPKSVDIRQLWATMSANLSRLRYRWEISEILTLPVATCSGNDLASEKVLDPAAMTQAQELLGTDRILVSVPRRTCIYAVPYALTEAQSMLFSKVVRTTYQDDSHGNGAITPGVFVVEDGRITDFISDPQVSVAAG
ncbi:hypothetical protein [Nocardia callitridis]|uniref:Uncharacterized protein n=1 Tax=Nocardia callitridis TaxID=648753 RepID=A0ABP9KM89_9NOCA